MRDKMPTPPKKKGKTNFKDARVRSDKMSAYKVGSQPSVVMKASSPEKENRADMDLRKLVSKKGVFPSEKGNDLTATAKRRNR